jgi:ADP-heptose:LPS heptosyltransferase
LSKKILVIRFSSIGDIVLTTPVIRALHLQLGAEVHFLTKGTFAPIIQTNPHVAKVITLSGDFGEMIRALKMEDYDHVIDLHHNIRTKRIKVALGIAATSFHKLNFEKWLLVRLGINRLPDIHIVDRYLDAARVLGVKKDDKGLDFYIPEESRVDTLNTFGFQPGSYISIVIGAAHQTKCLTGDQIIQLCKYLDMPVILLGGKEEIPKANLIQQAASPALVKNACGGFAILQSGSILQQSGAIIAHDTGLMHITAALKKPLVVIWGNTVPEFGMYPYYGSEDIKWISFEQKNLPCRPCTKIGFTQCPKGHFKCILDHDINEIALAAKSLLT